MTDSIITAAQEARADAQWLAAHGYETSLWRYSSALDCYGPKSSRTSYAAGYAVQYAGRLVRDDGSQAEYPSAGIKIWCADDQLPLDRLVKAGRALVTFDVQGNGEFSAYTAHYVAGYNPRDTELRRDQSVNPGTMQTVLLHELTPMIGGDGPLRFYDLRLVPASEFLPGDRVVVASGQHTGETGIVQSGESVLNGRRTVMIHTYAGHYQTVDTDTLEPFTFPAAGYVFAGDKGWGDGELEDAFLVHGEGQWRELIARYPWHGLGSHRVLAREPEPAPEGGWPLH